MAAEAQPSIADYAAIGNCKTLALVSRHGSIDWMCLPNFSGSSIFAALLDRERGGCFAIMPGEVLRVEQEYLPDTNVLRTLFHCRHGSAELVDAMAIGAGDLRAQHDLVAAHEVLRIFRCLDGEVEVRVLYEPRPEYARTLPRITARGRLGWQCTLGGTNLHLLTDFDLVPTGPATLEATQVLRRGEQRQASLSSCENEIAVVAPLNDALQQRLDATVAWWRSWCARCQYDGPYRRAVMRSCLALKLLSYCLSGAVVAAGTTSLPVAAHGERNWDYRYCWLRDTSLVLQSFMDLGYDDESGAFLAWLLNATRLTQPQLQVVYDVYGETSLRERQLPQLRGYHGIGPVRLGNAASTQLQLDVYGEVVLTACDFVQRGGNLDRFEKQLVAGFARTAASLWRMPDQGIWEIRLPPRHNTYSKLMCWAAIDRAIKLQEQIDLPIDAAHLSRERDALREDIDRHGYDATLQSYVGRYGSSDADASLLLIPRLGYVDIADPKMQGTLRHIEQQLSVDGMLYRYPPGPQYDGVDGGENLFVICSFWRVECLARAGRIDDAQALFDRLLALRNHVGLLTEEVDARRLELRGNFPQAFSHAGLITAALALQAAGVKP